MEQMSGLMEGDISGSGCRVKCAGMEYSDGLLKVFIMDSGKRKSKMVMVIGRRVMAHNIMDSGRMVNKMEKQFYLRMGSSTHANMRIIKSSLKLNIIFDFTKK
jgi:hypothetical protein